MISPVLVEILRVLSETADMVSCALRGNTTRLTTVVTRRCCERIMGDQAYLQVYRRSCAIENGSVGLKSRYGFGNEEEVCGIWNKLKSICRANASEV